MKLPAVRLPRLVSPASLHRAGVLGMNQRNYAYIMRYNRRADYPDVDDKLRTKQLAIRHHVATAYFRKGNVALSIRQGHFP